MKKTITTILLLLSTSVYANEIKIGRVTDGDTFKIQIDGMMKPLDNMSIRIRGIDTPEIHGYKCPLEKERGIEARAFLERKINNATSIEITDMQWDKYGGRILATVIIDGADVSESLVTENLATRYYGGRKVYDWCKTNK